MRSSMASGSLPLWSSSVSAPQQASTISGCFYLNTALESTCALDTARSMLSGHCSRYLPRNLSATQIPPMKTSALPMSEFKLPEAPWDTRPVFNPYEILPYHLTLQTTFWRRKLVLWHLVFLPRFQKPKILLTYQSPDERPTTTQCIPTQPAAMS
jgi:hypothetical protein